MTGTGVTMRLDLTDEQMQQAVAKAILDTLTPEKRDALLTEAVKNLISPGSSQYSGNKSALQEAFNNAVNSVAYRLAEKQVTENPEIMTAIGDLCIEAWKRVTMADEAREKLIESIAGAFRRTITGERY